MLIDSHCHIHDRQFYPEGSEDAYRRAITASVRMIVVGTSEEDSRQAATFAATHEGAWAAVGVHPHEAKDGWSSIAGLVGSAAASEPASKIVAIGEIGLDYHYSHSPRKTQIEAFEAQIEVARRHGLPVIFHVRDAFDDFWPVLDNFHGVRGVLHSFTDTRVNLEEGLARGLYVSINGISTFTKDEDQQAMYREIPLDRLLVETDAPFLTPAPFRGKVNEPAFVKEVAEYQARARGLSLSAFAATTSINATTLFSLT